MTEKLLKNGDEFLTRYIKVTSNSRGRMKKKHWIILALFLFVLFVEVILMSQGIRIVAEQPEKADVIWFAMTLVFCIPALIGIICLFVVFIRGIIAKRRLNNWEEYWEKKSKRINEKAEKKRNKSENK